MERCAPRALEGLLIHAVVQAFDNVYGGDLSATHTYGKGSLLEGAFADMIRSEGGRTTIDWDAFNATRPLGSPVRDADPGAARAAARPALHLVRLRARASYGTANPLDGGAPRSALEPYCPYSTRLCLLLAEGGVDFTMVKIDLTAVQGWYSAAFKPGDAPAMWGTPGGKTVSGLGGGAMAVCVLTSVEWHAIAAASLHAVRRRRDARSTPAAPAAPSRRGVSGGRAPSE